MKDKIEIIQYNKIDSDFNSIINLHQILFENSALNQRLIYFDTNFPIYFKKIIEQSKDDFVSVIKINNVVEGFIHLKISEETVFLNNISLRDNIQGKGYGKLLLIKSLDFLSCDKFKKFELDVFLSNKKALFWYEKLGLKIVSQRKWIKLSNKTHFVPKSEMIFDKDLNGFDSLFIDGNKIATVVNKTLLVNDLSYFKLLPLSSFEDIITNLDINSLNNIYEFVELEISVRMSVDLNQMILKLKNK